MELELTWLDATKLATLIRDRKVSAVQVMQTYLDRIEKLNPKINAIVTINHEALKSAEEADLALASGSKLGPLHGVPFTVKDSIDTANVPTQRGSPIFRNRTPTVNAASVERMLACRSNPPREDQSSRILVLNGKQ